MEEESGGEDIEESSVSKNMDKEVAGNLMCQGDDIYEDSDTEVDKKCEHGVKVLTDENPGRSTIQRLINNNSATECLFTNKQGDVIVYDLTDKSDVNLLYKLLSKPRSLQGCNWELWNRPPEAKTKGSFASCFQLDSESDDDNDDDGDACKNKGYESNDDDDDDDDDDVDVNSDDNCSADNDKKVSAKSESTGKRNSYVDEDVSEDSEEEEFDDHNGEDSESIESGKKSSKQSSKSKKKLAGKGKNKNDYCSY
jgi:hypothetical protein